MACTNHCIVGNRGRSQDFQKGVQERSTPLPLAELFTCADRCIEADLVRLLFEEPHRVQQEQRQGPLASFLASGNRSTDCDSVWALCRSFSIGTLPLVLPK